MGDGMTRCKTVRVGWFFDLGKLFFAIVLLRKKGGARVAGLVLTTASVIMDFAPCK
jgi:hypothetical protein